MVDVLSTLTHAHHGRSWFHSEYSKQLNEMRIKVLAAREAAIQEIVAEAKTKLREVSKNPTTYKKLMTDLLVQVWMLDGPGRDPCNHATMQPRNGNHA